MERLAQLLDHLDDLVAVFGLAAENVRRISLGLVYALLALLLQIGGVLFALAHPPLALATAMLMFVVLLYRTVTSPLEIA